ncbi:TetR/AcrR family transcriptional regulator [Nonomuraea soli]|uniref:AcrR family transcriptional regulator n=1 Tax=Nonomuraea soli TaxID=1032476 RepID=A0A7W0HNY8_9ACTN|nr:TetR/AcrR family transcriptional regulator [Nonomuraea soli]MBA2890304.1 AcrR family transcriptional regulator [Nonomuraea soli]
MRLTRAESKAANRRALIEAAREIVGRDGSRAKLEDITELAGLTTGAVYSLFGGKDGLMVAMVDDYTGPLDLSLLARTDPGVGLEEVVAEVARRYLEISADPQAAVKMLFEARVLDLVLNEAGLRAKLTASMRSTEVALAGMFAGRRNDGTAITHGQALRLARALTALLSGLGQGVVLGAHEASEEFFVEAALSLISPRVLGPA